MRIFFWLCGLVASAALAATSATAAVPRPSAQDDFRLGTGGTSLCQVQSQSVGPAIKGMFDRAYAIVCRDAAAPVGHLYALRAGADDPVARVRAARAEAMTCAAPQPAPVEELGATRREDCTLEAANVGYRAYSLTRGRTVYIAEGLTGYDSALRLGLRTIVADRPVPGDISVATTSLPDPAAFARVQAGTLDLAQALAEGYRRNNSGSYAEAAEFFDTLLTRDDGAKSQTLRGEYIVNRALQRSDLGEFAEADALFAEATKIPTVDPVQLRLRRNFMALHLLNQHRPADAIAELDRPLPPIAGPVGPAPEIDVAAAAAINARARAQQLCGSGGALTPEERALILDAQASQLRGTALRLQGKLPEAEAALNEALTEALRVREGRVTSITRLRAQTLAELSAIAETRGDFATAEQRLRDGLALLEVEYPASVAANSAKARLAAFLARRGQTDAALGLFREVVQAMTDSGASTSGLSNILAPYFALLIDQLPTHPALVSDFFLASQTVIRPGVADTQAELARELSSGDDQAAGLFRQSTALTREIERSRVQLAHIAALPAPTSEETAEAAALRTSLASLEADQVTTQAKLAEFPRYRALSTAALALPDVQAALRPGELYLKMTVVADAIYGLAVTHDDALAYRMPIGATALAAQVQDLRDSIAKDENGQLLTYPFDVKASRALFVSLTGPAAGRVAAAKHLIFEPDGAMLQLPANLLIEDQASVDAWLARQKRPKADEFDFTGLAWLGAKTDVSTAVSARSFRDVRQVPPSSAARQYLGFGQNAPVSATTGVPASRSVSRAGAIDCNWPLAAWDRPIAATELNDADRIIGDKSSAVVTGAAFSDTAVKARGDLAAYRILHFATHGLVTAPRPECPARPALLTSFGDAQSDGLLSFREIYDLKLNADLVILSACDTAGQASVAATREVGVTRGGGAALDGLVRAFVGAGSRVVMGSHWELPDDFNATRTLIAGLFEAPPGTPVTEALRAAQLKLMAKPETSHPYYWSGFAVVGDGAQPVLRAATATASAEPPTTATRTR